MSSKKVTLISSDEVPFETDTAVVAESQVLKYLIEDVDATSYIIRLPNVRSKILARVIAYCKKRVEKKVSGEDLETWDAEFVRAGQSVLFELTVDQAVLFDLILAANYLNIKSLLDLLCQTVADMIKGKSPAEIRRIFNIESPFTPDEEEEIRRENAWAFE